MKAIDKLLILVLGSSLSLPCMARTVGENEPRPVFPVPSANQLRWQEMEFYAFFHWGMNTILGKQWGDGSDDASQFVLDCQPQPAQWLEVARSAGMTGGVVVAKHHDGFCNWPSEATAYCVRNAGNEEGRRMNLVRDFVKAADSLSMRYGYYLSPWDRNNALYATSQYMSEVYLPQLAELLAIGPDPFLFWMDSANNGYGYYGGAKETRSINALTYYDTPNLRALLHQTAPQCIVFMMTPDGRWIGNEEGWAGETNWCAWDYGCYVDKMEYGSPEGFMWTPGESDAMTQYGWFYSYTPLYSTESLFKTYLETVGRNANLLMNLAPSRSGVIEEPLARLMAELGEMLQTRLGHDLAPTAEVTASVTREAGATRSYDAAKLVDGDKDTYWASPDGMTSAEITFAWPDTLALHYVSLQEYLPKGQRVKAFSIESSLDGNDWQFCAPGVITTTIGHKRIVPLNGSTTDSYAQPTMARYLRVTIHDAKACPLLHTISIY